MASWIVSILGGKGLILYIFKVLLLLVTDKKMSKLRGRERGIEREMTR